MTITIESKDVPKQILAQIKRAIKTQIKNRQIHNSQQIGSFELITDIFMGSIDVTVIDRENDQLQDVFVYVQ